MPPPTLSLDSLGSLAATSLERSFSSSSLRASSSPSKASPGRVPQKSFGRLPARVAAAPVRLVVPAPAPVVTHADSSSSLTLSLDDIREEIARDLPPIEDEVDRDQDKAELHAEIEVLREALQDLRDASSKNDEAWQRENARLKEQLTAASTREAAQQEQLRLRDDQLALCRQELHELQEHQLKAEEEQAALVRPSLDEAGSSGLGRERELLKLVVQLVGASNVRAVLREHSTASPAQLREALVRLRCSQCRRLSPTSRASSPAKSMGSGQTDRLHKMLFGSPSRPPSPTAIRFNSTGPRSPLK